MLTYDEKDVPAPIHAIFIHFNKYLLMFYVQYLVLPSTISIEIYFHGIGSLVKRNDYNKKTV